MMTNTLERAGSKTSTATLWLAAIVVVGAVLRLWRLGDLSIVADENISVLAVDGILAHGYPLLPSGMIYWRLGWFGYIVAGFAEWFGREDHWMRLPAVLFSVATIPLAYWFASRLFSKPVGLFVAALVALSPAEIEIARLVRMYAPFAFCYLLTVLVIHRRYVEHSAKTVWLPLLLAFLSLITHQLGFALAIVFLVPLLIVPQTNADKLRLVASSVITGVAFVMWDATIAGYMLSHVPPTGLPPEAVVATGGLLGALPAPIAKILGQFAVPPLDFAAHLYTTAPPGILALAVALTVLAFGAAAYLHRRASWPVVALALATVAACALHQTNVAVILFVGYVLAARQGIRTIVTAPAIALLVTIGASFAAWLAYAYVFTEPNAVAAAGISTHVRQSIRTLLDFPQYNVMWGFFFEMPLASFAAVVGILWCLDGTARREPDSRRAFLLVGFLLPLVVSGSVGTTYRELRYIMHFDVMFLTFVALGVWHWRDVLVALAGEEPWRGLASPRPWLAGRSLGTVGLVVLAFCYVPGPAAAWLTVDRDHGFPEGVGRAFRLSFRPDYRTAAAYVKEHRDPSREPLVTPQPRELYPYLHDVDYWLTAHAFEIENHAYPVGGERRDLYVDAPIISTLRELEDIVARSPAVWLVVPDQIVASRDTVSEDLAAYIERHRAQIVYTALDGDMRVYRLTGEHR